jgi:hypothetical protein
MPKYFFDFEDGTNIHRDDEGIELSETSVACQQMRSTLLEIGKDVITIEEQRQLVGIIRDANGVLWRGRLSLEIG